MRESNKVNHKKGLLLKKILLTIVIIVVVLPVAGFFLWIGVSRYPADAAAKEALLGNEIVETVKESYGIKFDGPGAENAMIFYPGGLVDYRAYAPLMLKLAENGMDCYLLKMPLDLAVFDIDKGEKVLQMYEAKHWYVGGHSLGGAMGSAFAAKHPEKIEGMLFLASYSTKELPDTYKVLSLYGTNDGVLGMDKYEEAKTLLPDSSEEICIEGGNHAWFGSYGEQKGDGEATITHEEQWNITAQAVNQYLLQ